MAAILEAESTLTDRYQTTVPEPVRRALRLGKRDKIHYTIRPDGEVVLKRVVDEEDDHVVSQFLHFLERDMARHPEHILPVDAGQLRRVQALVGDVEVDLDTALPADGE